MSTTISYILDSILILESIAFIVAGVKQIQSTEDPKKRLFFYLGLTLMVELSGFFMNKWGVSNNQWLYNFYEIIEVWLLFSILIFYVNHRKQHMIRVLMIMSYLAIGINAIFFAKPLFLQYYNYGFSIYSLLISVGGLIVLYDILISDRVLQIHRLFSFWFIIGVLFYSLCRLPLAIISNIYQDLFTSKSIVILIQPFSSILKLTCFIIGYLWSKDQS